MLSCSRIFRFRNVFGSTLRVLCSALLLAGSAIPTAAADLEAMRREIADNGYHFEVDGSFMDSLTPEEKDNLYGFVLPPNAEEEFRRHLKIFPTAGMRWPTYFNWADYGGITPVKSQGGCGSCWAFAATAEMEAFVKIHYGESLDLSEQQIVSCNTGGSGCDGGWAQDAYDVWLDEGGVLEDCHPYLGVDPPTAPCLQDQFKKYARVLGYISVSNNVEQIKAALQNGPVCSYILASEAFENYGSGCFDQDGWTGEGHLILIVGWDDDACGGGGAWIIKNSWGTDWGESGFGTIAWGVLSIGSWATQLVYDEPEVHIDVTSNFSSTPVYADSTMTVTWTSTGPSFDYVDVWLDVIGGCYDIPVATDVPNTGSYDWVVNNISTEHAHLMLTPSDGGTDYGYGFSDGQFTIIGHKTIYVSSTGSDEPPYGTPATAAHSIADAVYTCAGTDTVLVAGGDYLEHVSIGSTVRIFGGYSADFTTRDVVNTPSRMQHGTNAMSVSQGAGSFSVIDGFVFHDCYGGYFSEPINSRHGAGMYISRAAPLVRNCRFEDNTTVPGTPEGYGGGVCVFAGSPIFENCIFTGNAGLFGGALAATGGSNVTLTACELSGNASLDSLTTGLGGAVYVDDGVVTLTDCDLLDNGSAVRGGAIAVDGGNVVLDDCRLTNNRANETGGGIDAAGGTVTTVNCVIEGNTTNYGSGGGLYASGADLDVANTLFTGNTATQLGGGIYGTNVTGSVENCLLTANGGLYMGGIFLQAGGPMTLRNTMIVDNLAQGINASGAELERDYNLCWNNVGGDYLGIDPGPHDLQLDPLFVNAGAGDYGLAVHSPAIDAGAEDPACLDPDGSRADIGLLGGPAALTVAPAAVAGATVGDIGGGQAGLAWTANTEPDVSYYVVYRDTAEVFLPDPAKALATVTHPTTTYVDTPTEDCYYLIAAVDSDGYAGGYSARLAFSPDGSPVADETLPQVLAIRGIAPNPFNPKTEIRYDVPRDGWVDLSVFDVRGRKVCDLVSGQQAAGRHSVTWTGRDDRGQSVAAGVYFARVTSSDGTRTAKMVLTK